MFALRGRARLNVRALAVRNVTRYKRVKPPPVAAAAPAPAAPVATRGKKRDELLSAALTKPLARRPPVPGGFLMNEELVKEAEELGKGLDTDGAGRIDLRGVEMSQSVVELPDDPEVARKEEERHFQDFFDRGDEDDVEAESVDEEPVRAEPTAAESEVTRKLGPAAATRERVADLREAEEAEERRSQGGKPAGFEQRGRRDEFEELEENEAKERVRQRRVHMQDDRLCVGDVVVPQHLEKWVLDPTGDHKQRHKKQRLKEERIQKWNEMHGMYYERKKQSAFKRDPVDTDMTLRQKRVSMLVQEALEQVFAVDFEHESVPQLLIEGVEMSVDMRRCKILFGSDDKGVDGFLHRQGPAIRMLLTRRVQMKYSPTLDFIRTDFEKKQARLDAVLDSVLLPAEGEEPNVVGEVEEWDADAAEPVDMESDEELMKEVAHLMEQPENLSPYGNGEAAEEELLEEMAENDEEEEEEEDDDDDEDEGEDNEDEDGEVDEEDEDEDGEEKEPDLGYEEWLRKIPVKITYV